jgi:hypothetical protein
MTRETVTLSSSGGHVITQVFEGRLPVREAARVLGGSGKLRANTLGRGIDFARV